MNWQLSAMCQIDGETIGMRFRLVTWTAVIAAMALGAPAEAQVECVFDRLSTVEGLDRLDDYGFRVVGSETGLTLEQRYADGSWIAHGDVQRRDVPDFTVYEHLPLDGRGTVSVLTVHGSGSASLMQHHNSSGNMRLQYRKAWLYHGECTGA
ncbi:hypothetical protein [Roseovarius sp. C03]|uniref:hypothetical protein n=1 Tax=Roseovarius sp. C03 TaxID=3449222 RepID=UPI003EDC3A9A